MVPQFFINVARFSESFYQRLSNENVQNLYWLSQNNVPISFFFQAIFKIFNTIF